MAEVVHDGEFWLPSDFFPEDFFLPKTTLVAETKDGVCGGTVVGNGVRFPNEFPYDYESNLSSPVDSVTETESDEEEFMAGLTRQMAHSFLHEDEKKSSTVFNPVNCKSSLACSPQSPLRPTGTWSKVPTNWYAFLKLSQEEEEQQKLAATRALLGIPTNTSHPPPPPPPPVFSSVHKNDNISATGYYSNTYLTHRQLQVSQFNHLKQQQMLKQQQCNGVWGRQQNRGRVVGVGSTNGRVFGRPHGFHSPGWPSLPHRANHHNSSGMRAVFLGQPGSRSQSCGGTGVFLPRTTDFRKKPAACSTVLLPARVVQALNLNLDDLSAQPRFQGGFPLDHETARNNSVTTQKRNLRPHSPVAVNNPLHLQHEVGLPPEWTY